mmetsp:Transcript_72716/g.196673  ORF Transcript_72716/g.196673 Transcript_72716/m.196673 type:complete len:296 (-) Transcript_72716:61-948(-)
MLMRAVVARLAPHGAAGPAPDLPWRARAWLLQGAAECELGASGCAAEVHEMLALFVGLCVCLVGVVCLLNSFGDDRGEQVKPLSPQMVVTATDFRFRLPLTGPPANLEVLRADGGPAGHVLVERKQVADDGVAIRARLQDERGKTLATVVSRDATAAPYSFGVTLFRGSDEGSHFGSVELEGRGEYHVRHRTGVHLLTICGDFDEWDVVGTNCAGAKVFSFKKIGEECVGSVILQVDAGLVIASLVAIHLHRSLPSSGQRTAPSPASPSPRRALLFGAPALEEGAVLSPLQREDD